MTALFVYLAVALGFSFLCSIVEAVLLSVSTAYIRLLEAEGRRSGRLLKAMKQDIDAPLAAILTLNTIAHTAGAAGVGAQAANIFGDHLLGVASAILTLLILIFSEIIPKTLGSVYWRQLAPGVAYILKYLVKVLYPFVLLSKLITRKIAVHPTLSGFSREEFAAMASLGEQEGELSESEARILKNVFKLRDMKVSDVMTPRAVMYALPADITVDVFFNKYETHRFSRIPVYSETPDGIESFVLRSDLLKAKARGNSDKSLSNYRRDITAVPDKLSLLTVFEEFIKTRSQIMTVVDEYGVLKGLITLEDVIETLMGLEIVDEHDYVDDLQKLAKRRWRRRAEQLGIVIDDKV